MGALCAGLGAATVALGVVLAFGVREEQRAAARAKVAAAAAAAEPARHPAPMAPIQMEGVVVRAATKDWSKKMHRRPLKAGEPVPVLITIELTFTLR